MSRSNDVLDNLTPGGPAPPATRAQVLVCAGVVAMALIARLAHLSALSRTPFFEGLIVDAQGYAHDSEILLAQGGMEVGFYRPPLYAYVRAGLALLGVSSPWALRIAHACAGSATAGLLSLTTWRLVPDHRPRIRVCAAWIAGCASALYGPLVIYDVELVPVAWVNVLIALAYLLTVRARDRWSTSDLVAGFCLGLATTGWGPAAVLSLPLLLLRLQNTFSGSRSVTAATFAAALSVPIGLTSLHNATHGAPGIVISGNLGINLWLGNNPRWRETSRARPGIYYDLEFQRATRAGAITLPAIEKYYLSLAYDDVTSRPLDAIRRTAEKFYLVLHGREVRRDQDLLWFREISRTISVLMWERGIMFPFGVLLPFALACPRRCLRPKVKETVLLGAALYAGSVAPFTMAGRYRLPIVVLLVPISAVSVAAAAAAWSRFRERGHVLRLRWSWLVLLCAIVVCNLPNAYTATFAATASERLCLLGQAYAAKHDLRPAVEASRQAARISPDDADAHIQLGQLLMETGAAPEAAYHFYRAGKIVPESEGPWVLHGQAMLMLGRYGDAIYNFREALQRNRFHGEALRGLATAYLLSGFEREAVSTLRRYLEVGYQDDGALNKLTRMLFATEGRGAALTLLQELETRNPRWAHVHEVRTKLEHAESPWR